ncbi:hypothetical protein MAH4_35950 [Sessilibacter sp. MAH4]
MEKVFHDDVTGGGNFNKRPVMTQIISYLKANPHKNYIEILNTLAAIFKNCAPHCVIKHGDFLVFFLAETTTDSQLIFRVFF